MTLHDVRVPPQLLLVIPWVAVREVIPAEYVEKDRAYESLAIVGPTPATAVLVQPLSVDRRIRVGIPSGEKLRHLAALVDGFRR